MPINNVTIPVKKHKITAYSGGFPCVYVYVIIAITAVGPTVTNPVPPTSIYKKHPTKPEYSPYYDDRHIDYVILILHKCNYLIGKIHKRGALITLIIISLALGAYSFG